MPTCQKNSILGCVKNIINVLRQKNITEIHFTQKVDQNLKISNNIIKDIKELYLTNIHPTTKVDKIILGKDKFTKNRDVILISIIFIENQYYKNILDEMVMDNGQILQNKCFNIYNEYTGASVTAFCVVVYPHPDYNNVLDYVIKKFR